MTTRNTEPGDSASPTDSTISSPPIIRMPSRRSRSGPVLDMSTILYETFIIMDGYLTLGIICFNANTFYSA